MIDLSAVPQAALGDVVTVVGADGEQSIAVQDVAQQLGAPSAVYWMLSLESIPYRYHH